MFRSMRFSKIAKSIIGKTTEELVKVMLRNQHPDLYFSMEEQVVKALSDAYEEGLKAGRKEVTEAVMKFDLEKDKLGN